MRLIIHSARIFIKFTEESTMYYGFDNIKDLPYPWSELHDLFLVQELREKVLRGKYRIPFYMSTDAEHLLRRLLVLNAQKRPTLEVCALIEANSLLARILCYICRKRTIFAHSALKERGIHKRK